MSLRDQLEARVSEIFRSTWTYADARVVPETKSIGLGNFGKKLSATVLYADLDASTLLVENYTREFAAEMYKAFLYCAARLITFHGGSIRAYDGDRVMGVFQGDDAASDAVKVALKLHWAVKHVVNEKLLEHYPNTKYRVRHTVGIDSSDILVVRGGVRDNNDLAWVGSAANFAAKLNALSSDYPTWITHRVYDRLGADAKYGGSPRRLMWEDRRWTAMNNMRIYRSNWTWAV